jgi:hypothetical protein
VEYITTYVAATAIGAAFPGACSAWTTTLPGLGDTHARTQIQAAGQPDERFSAVRHIPAPSMRLVPMTRHLPMTLPSAVVSTRKQTTNVNKTRTNAGGYGALGPHPEREPA